MTDKSPEQVGLCASCRFVEVVVSSHDATFYLCTLSSTNPAFRRYPVLPVRDCSGHEPTRPTCPACPA